MRAALEGLSGVEAADVDLQTGTAIMRVGGGLTVEDAVEAVQGKVILSWARGLLARLPFLGGGRP